MTRPSSAAPDLERIIGRLILAGTYLSVVFIGAGVILMLLAGVSPFDPARSLAPGRLVADLAALRPEGFLWLGLVAVIATPSIRVAAALIGYATAGERRMAGVAVGILAVIGASVILATGLSS